MISNPPGSRSRPRWRGRSSRSPRETRVATASIEQRSAPAADTAAAGAPLYISPLKLTCDSASQCVAACSGMTTMSSLNAAASAPPIGVLIASIVRTGLMRPGTPVPSCGPFRSSGIPSGMRRPVPTSAAACRTTWSVMKLSVPISSCSPQRPQLQTRLAISSNSIIMLPSGPLPARAPRRRSGRTATGPDCRRRCGCAGWPR